MLDPGGGSEKDGKDEIIGFLWLKVVMEREVEPLKANGCLLYLRSVLRLVPLQTKVVTEKVGRGGSIPAQLSCVLSYAASNSEVDSRSQNCPVILTTMMVCFSEVTRQYFRTIFCASVPWC